MTAPISTGAILGFIALVLGAIASWFGGVTGTKHNGVIVSEAVTRRDI